MVEDGRDGREERDADFASFDAVGDGDDLDDGVVVALNAADALERQLQEEEIRRCVRVWKSSEVRQLGAGQVAQVVKLLTLVTKDTSLHPSPLMASKGTLELVSLINSWPILR